MLITDNHHRIGRVAHFTSSAAFDPENTPRLPLNKALGMRKRHGRKSRRKLRNRPHTHQ